MCEICVQTPCTSRCPNASEKKLFFSCSECGEQIYEGYEYFDSKVGAICKECMEDKSFEEILEVVGEKMKVAEVA